MDENDLERLAKSLMGEFAEQETEQKKQINKLATLLYDHYSSLLVAGFSDPVATYMTVELMKGIVFRQK